MTALITSVPTVEFYPQRLTQPSRGLFAAIDQGRAWVDVGNSANRFSIGGVNIRTINYGGDESTGVWNAPWCGSPTPSNASKSGIRPSFLDPFEPIVTWAYDSCDPSPLSRAEVRENAQRWLEIHSPLRVEQAFADRIRIDDGTPATADSFIKALGKIELAIAETGLPGFIHASPIWAPYAAELVDSVRPNPGSLPITTMGSTWVFGGGYGTLGNLLVATSQPYGWRDSPAITEAMYEPEGGPAAAVNQFVVVAEQTFVVGYEHVIGSVSITSG